MSPCSVAADDDEGTDFHRKLDGKKGMSSDLSPDMSPDMLGGKKGFSMTPAPSLSAVPSSTPSSAPSSSPSDAGTCDPEVAVYGISTTAMTFAATPKILEGRPQCTLTPVSDNVELQKILALANGNPTSLPGAWVGIENPTRMARDGIQGDTTNLLTGWVNINDGTFVPAFSNLWRSNEPNNLCGGSPCTPDGQRCAHVFNNVASSSPNIAGYLRDVRCTDSFVAVYKCCDGMAPFPRRS